jgi:DNA-binding transcriptional LysR family regulator
MIRSLIVRELDLVLARGRPVLADESVTERLNIEILFHDHLVVATGAQNRWAKRRKIDLAELVNERWILSGPGTWNHAVVVEAFRARGLPPPKMSVETLSMHLRANLLATGSFISVFPHSVMRLYAERFSLKVLPADLPPRPWPVTIVTLKNRTLSPVVERFVETARATATALAPKRAPSLVAAMKTRVR